MNDSSIIQILLNKIAQLLINLSNNSHSQFKLATVADNPNSGKVNVVFDGQETPVSIKACPNLASGDRAVVLSFNKNLAFAISPIKSTKIRNEIVNYKGLSIYFSQSGTSLLVQVYGTANQNIAANESMAAIIPQWFSDVYYQGYYGYVANGSGMFVVSSNNVSITAAISTGSSPRYVWVGLANSP